MRGACDSLLVTLPENAATPCHVASAASQCCMQHTISQTSSVAFARATMMSATLPLRTWLCCCLDARRCARDLPVAAMQRAMYATVLNCVHRELVKNKISLSTCIYDIGKPAHARSNPR